jgi:cell division protein FtsA
MAQATRTIAGLDIGTTKIQCVIADQSANGDLRVVGVGRSVSDGLRRGVVVDLEKTVVSIKRAVDEAQRMAGRPIKGVHAGIAGDHIRSINGRGVVAISRRDNEITQDDVDRVTEAAKTIAIPNDREIIHCLPQEFIVDDQYGVRDPRGMSGMRLEAEVHIITGAVSSARNICRAIQHAGLKVFDLTLQPLASAEAVLEQDERNLGVVLLDIGGGTTDMAVFHEGSVRDTHIIPLGGASITNDLAVGLRTPIDKAEAIKIQSGLALASMANETDMVEVPGVGGRGDRAVERKQIAKMIEPRMEEIFQMANKAFRKNPFAQLVGGGVVLTGGSSLLPGALELAEQVFEMPARLGAPRGLAGMSSDLCDPRYSTGIGLVMYAVNAQEGTGDLVEVGASRTGTRIQDRFKKWLADLF